ncbi:MAG: aromatic ring-hydroxylating dioxygenase subunit alpha [Aquabacterium sp.]
MLPTPTDTGALPPPACDTGWGDAPTSRAPGRVYTDPDWFQTELERFFYRGHWCYVALECEIPEPGEFIRSVVGQRSVIVVRDLDGVVRVVENRCAHRGVAFCRERQGRVKDFVCPYHQWNYNLKGDLIGLPFRRGLRQDGRVVGGMPADFDLREHGLTQLRVACRGGAIFATFDADAEPFEDFVGPEVLAYFDRVFHGRPLKLLGYNRQRIPANWKLMQENIKDPYHPGLLHTWFVTFGLWRADQRSRMVVDRHGRHAAMVSTRNAGGAGAATQGVTTFRADMQLHDARLLDVVPEPWWGEPSVVMTTLFPSLIIQQQVNSLSMRHIRPVGPGAFDFVWTHFGYADDDAAMTERRLRQANLFGPAGFVSADDGEVIAFVQQAFEAHGAARTHSELDGRGTGPADHMVTETLIRGLYAYWRGVMQI